MSEKIWWRTSRDSNYETNKIAVSEDIIESWIHLGMVQGHEDRVDNDTESDEQVDEGVEDEEFDDVWDLVPVRMTLPTEQEKFTLLLQKLFLVHAFPVAEQAWKWTSIAAVNSRSFNFVVFGFDF